MTDNLSIIRRIARPRADSHSAPHAAGPRPELGGPSSRGRAPTEEPGAWTMITVQDHRCSYPSHRAHEPVILGPQIDRTSSHTYLTPRRTWPALARALTHAMPHGSDPAACLRLLLAAIHRNAGG